MSVTFNSYVQVIVVFMYDSGVIMEITPNLSVLSDSLKLGI
jgi:hypothetical protein